MFLIKLMMFVLNAMIIGYFTDGITGVIVAVIIQIVAELTFKIGKVNTII